MSFRTQSLARRACRWVIPYLPLAELSDDAWEPVTHRSRRQGIVILGASLSEIIMSAPQSFTDEELLAYMDERVSPTRAAEVERQLRASSELLNRLLQLLQSAERGDVTLGGMWRRGRWSCPPRAVWAGFVSGRLGDGLSQYLQFHLDTVGCRICEASVRDLRETDGDDGELRVRKIFQSSAGKLHKHRD